MKRRLGSVLATTIAGYLSLKEALGRAYTREREVLAHLDAFLTAAGSDLTSETFQRWIMSRSHLTSGVRRKYMRIVRGLCLYRRRTDPECFVPDPSQFPPRHQAVKPYVFQEAEITRLLEETRRIPLANRSPLRRQNALLGLVLLYTAGLRRGELLRLTVGDCDLSEGTVLVRESKFHKSRLLPLSADALNVLKAVLRERQANRLPLFSGSPLLWNGYRRENPGRLRSAYLLGVLSGFRDKLEASRQEGFRRAEAESGQNPFALTATEDRRLERFVETRYPRLRNIRGGRTLRDGISFEAGRSEGKNLVLRRGIDSRECTRGGLLPRS